MSLPHFYQQIITPANEADNPIPAGDYEECTFRGITARSLEGSRFSDCVFENCDLSNASLNGTAFREVSFSACKMIGLHFDRCNSLGIAFRFKECILNHSSFFGLKIKGTSFVKCKMTECDLSQTDLSQSLFDDCDLLNSTFDKTSLEKADLNTSVNITLDPSANRLKGAKFNIQSLPGLLLGTGIIVID